jgi:hypothetical protein
MFRHVRCNFELQVWKRLEAFGGYGNFYLFFFFLEFDIH